MRFDQRGVRRIQFVVSALLAYICLSLTPTASAAVGQYLAIVQDNRLFSVSPTTGSYVQKGNPDWGGATSLTTLSRSAGGGTPSFWMIQDSKLWYVALSNGSYTQVGTSDWSGPTLMVAG